MRSFFFVFMLFSLITPTAHAAVVKGIETEGFCAVVGITAEQGQLTALQRARAAAVEQAAGVQLSSSTLVTDLRMAADFIKTFSRGMIVRESVEWLPMGQYQKDKNTPPVPEYRVKLVADVAVPEMKTAPLHLSAGSNASVYRSGEKAVVTAKTARPAIFAVFNLMANDEVVMLYPNDLDAKRKAGTELIWPAGDSVTELEMATLPGHERDTEAFLVTAIDPAAGLDVRNVFTPGRPMKLPEFFRKFAPFAECGEDAIIAYEVVK